MRNLRNYSKGILIPIIIILGMIFVGIIDGGAEAGTYQKKMNATVEVVITLENGHQYVVENYDTEVTINTYNEVDPVYWEIAKY